MAKEFDPLMLRKTEDFAYIEQADFDFNVEELGANPKKYYKNVNKLIIQESEKSKSTGFLRAMVLLCLLYYSVKDKQKPKVEADIDKMMYVFYATSKEDEEMKPAVVGVKMFSFCYSTFVLTARNKKFSMHDFKELADEITANLLNPRLAGTPKNSGRTTEKILRDIEQLPVFPKDINETRHLLMCIKGAKLMGQYLHNLIWRGE